MKYEGKKQFKVTHGWHQEMSCVVEIYFDFPSTFDRIREMVEFWAGWEKRLSWNHGDYVKTFLQMVGGRVQDMALSEGLDTWCIRSAFAKLEGWYPMDGSEGINILRHSTLVYDCDDFEVQEVSGQIELEISKKI